MGASSAPPGTGNLELRDIRGATWPKGYGMRPSRSFIICLLVALSAGCRTSPNPDFCCVTAETCAAAGLHDERRPCEAGQACKDYGCVAADCRSSADCTSPEAPTCLEGLCVAGCSADDDCAGVTGRPRCDASDATCVGCLSNDQCPADRAFCDADTRSCRGCTADDQCASGVCIEATGICAADSAIIYVTDTGVDAGTCSKSAPCKTMAFAMGLTSPARNVIRVLGGSFYLGDNVVYTGDSVVIDGNNTSLISGSRPAIQVYGDAVIEGVRLSSTYFLDPLLRITSGGNLRLTRVAIEHGQLEVRTGGELDAVDIKMVNGDLRCQGGGVLAVRRSNFEQSQFGSVCKLNLSASRFEPPPGFLPVTLFQGPAKLIENNVFIGTGNDGFLIGITGAGSLFRFNTVVNTSSITGSAVAVGCEDGVEMTSNIIAYNSTSPLSCASRYSLFDIAGSQEVDRGIGNVSADIVTFFQDRQAGDYHLSSNSPALGIGEPGLVTTDLDGNARPVPAGTLPDVGAYEAP